MLMNITKNNCNYLKFSTLDHCGFSWIHLENWLILSVRLSLGVQPRVFRRSPEMAYLRSCPGLELWKSTRLYLSCLSSEEAIILASCRLSSSCSPTRLNLGHIAPPKSPSCL